MADRYTRALRRRKAARASKRRAQERRRRPVSDRIKWRRGRNLLRTFAAMSAGVCGGMHVGIIASQSGPSPAEKGIAIASRIIDAATYLVSTFAGDHDHLLGIVPRTEAGRRAFAARPREVHTFTTNVPISMYRPEISGSLWTPPTHTGRETT